MDVINDSPSYFLRGLFFGVLVTVVAEAFLIYRFVNYLIDPSRRFFNVSSGDRPSFAKDFVGANGGKNGSGTTADHELLNEELLSPKTQFGASTASHQSREHHEPWPEGLVEFLRVSLTASEGDTPLPAAAAGKNGATPESIDLTAIAPTEPCQWINVLAHRYFLALRGSELFKTKARAKWTEKINSKLKGNAFLSRVEITDLSLGDNAPTVHGVRLLKGMSEDLAVTADLDLTYTGGGSIAIAATLTGGLKLPVRVRLGALAGKVRFRCPSVRWPDMIGIAFVEDPGAAFHVDSPITVGDNEYLRGMVNKLLSGVVRKIFLELWVLPSWRTLFLPLMEPKLEDILARSTAVKEAATKVSRKPSGNSRSNTLWETRSPLLRNSKLAASGHMGDLLHRSSLPIGKVLNSEFDPDEAENVLVQHFLRIATDQEAKTSVTKRSNKKSGLTKDDESESASANSGDHSPDSPTSDTTNADKIEDLVATTWKSVRNRNGIHVQKKRFLVGDDIAEITRAATTIHCDAERVFSVLSNPEHNRHLDEAYVDSEYLHSYEDGRAIRKSMFNFGKQGLKDLTVFEVKRKRPEEATMEESNAGDIAGEEKMDAHTTTSAQNSSFIVVFRSVKEPELARVELSESEPIDGPQKATNTDTPVVLVSSPVRAEPQVLSDGEKRSFKSVLTRGRSASEDSYVDPSQQRSETAVHKDDGGTIYLFGYLITPDMHAPNEACNVIMISQMSLDLARLEVSFDMCRKLKLFIEELASLTGIAASRQPGSLQRSNSDASSGLRKRRFFSDSSATHIEGRKIEKLRNLVGSTATYLIKSRKVAGWLGGGRAGNTSGNHHLEEMTNMSDAGSYTSTATSGLELSALGDEASEGELEASFELPEERGHRKELTGESLGGFSSHSEDEHATSDIITEDHSGGFTGARSGVISTRQSSSAISDHSSEVVFAGPAEPQLQSAFTDRYVSPKEFVRIEIPYVPTFYDASSGPSFVIEMTSTQDANQAVSFGLYFRSEVTGDSQFNTDSHNVLPLLAPSPSDVQGRTLFPTSPVHLSGTIWTVIPLKHFSAGIIVVIFNNLQKSPKRIKYRADIVEKFADKQGLTADVTIGRKTISKFPIVINQQDKDSASEKQELCWEFSTGGFDVMFGVIYEPFDSEESESVALLVDVPPPLPIRNTSRELLRASSAVLDSSIDDKSEDSRSADNVSAPEEQSIVIGDNGGIESGLVDTTNASDEAKSPEPLLSGIDSDVSLLSPETRKSPPQPIIPPRPNRRALSPSPASASAASPPPIPSRPTLSSRLAAVVGGNANGKQPSPLHTAASMPSLSSSTSTSTSPNSTPKPTTASKPSASTRARPRAAVHPAKHRGANIRGKLDVTGKPGVYTFVWDNGYSLVVTKRVNFKIWIHRSSTVADSSTVLLSSD
ncbi:hypothetical protein DFS34DRAFT_695230 [Phlyctochytrium arcticum]|nr:hypothetical protein DFS34DRAFT_695230 [Phlyctochytrium arcticum]